MVSVKLLNKTQITNFVRLLLYSKIKEKTETNKENNNTIYSPKQPSNTIIAQMSLKLVDLNFEDQQ
jgi:hypothetical protein